MTDVRLYNTADGGEIDFVNGQAVMADGLETAVFLSLFGGNDQDSGLPGDDSVQWWGNIIELDPLKRHRSQTQNLLRSIPAIPANLRRIEDAVAADLSWMIETKMADFVSGQASLTARNRVLITVRIEIQKQEFQRSFPADWGTSA